MGGAWEIPGILDDRGAAIGLDRLQAPRTVPSVAWEDPPRRLAAHGDRCEQNIDRGASKGHPLGPAQLETAVDDDHGRLQPCRESAQDRPDRIGPSVESPFAMMASAIPEPARPSDVSFPIVVRRLAG
jgi:hypothetical protein